MFHQVICFYQFILLLHWSWANIISKGLLCLENYLERNQNGHWKCVWNVDRSRLPIQKVYAEYLQMSLMLYFWVKLCNILSDFMLLFQHFFQNGGIYIYAKPAFFPSKFHLLFMYRRGKKRNIILQPLKSAYFWLLL